MELYVKVKDAIRAIDIIQDAARDAEKDIRSAEKQINYRMDEWMRRYESDYASVTDRKVNKAKSEGYSEGYEEGNKRGKTDGEREALKKFQATTQDKNEKLSKKYKKDFGVEIIGEPRLIEKRLIDVGEPHDNVTTREYDLGDPKVREQYYRDSPKHPYSRKDIVTEVIDPEDKYSAKITKAVPVYGYRLKEHGHVTDNVLASENYKPSVVLEAKLPNRPLHVVESDNPIINLREVHPAHEIHTAHEITPTSTRVREIHPVREVREAPHSHSIPIAHTTPRVIEVGAPHKVGELTVTKPVMGRSTPPTASHKSATVTRI